MSAPIPQEYGHERWYSEQTMAAVVKERDALLAEHATLTRALRAEARSDCTHGCNEEGEDYVRCGQCGGSAWGDECADIEHGDECRYAALSLPLSKEVPDA